MCSFTGIRVCSVIHNILHQSAGYIKRHRNLPPYNLYWFQQAFPSVVVGLLPIYIIVKKPQLRLALSHELINKFYE